MFTLNYEPELFPSRGRIARCSVAVVKEVFVEEGVPYICNEGGFKVYARGPFFSTEEAAQVEADLYNRTH